MQKETRPSRVIAGTTPEVSIDTGIEEVGPLALQEVSPLAVDKIADDEEADRMSTEGIPLLALEASSEDQTIASKYNQTVSTSAVGTGSSPKRQKGITTSQVKRYALTRE